MRNSAGRKSEHQHDPPEGGRSPPHPHDSYSSPRDARVHPRGRRKSIPRKGRSESGEGEIDTRSAAFFDLDRTLLRRSSALALAGSFRDRGLISRRQLAKAAAWQLLFVLRGASHEAVRRAAEDGLLVLRGFTPEEMRELAATALEPVLRPLVYQEPLELLEHHRRRGEPVYIVSATLQEIVETIADDLDFDGALGTICEVGPDGAYTGKAVRALHADAKARCVRELAASEGFDLAECTAYSDSHTDLPFLEAVGYPVGVNPDRELRRICADRGWPVLEFSKRAYPHARRRVPPAVLALPFVVLAVLYAVRRRSA
jgi:HAD superfamily hydrolase (TIGR01490 family)